ncbi:unnamed protein product [Prorocentrum cordatum]|uniref:Ion transport domain-containing protein n=1 Tax=Prorocentrum cordatum TaxID=2364126 RepID=A0ABN9Y8Q7_9DINO|nr:unnamed protein product [Polarella glacialis]
MSRWGPSPARPGVPLAPGAQVLASALPPAAPAASLPAWSEHSPSREQVDLLIDAVRSTIREELGDLFAKGGHVRSFMRSEVDAALQSWGCELAVSMASRPTATADASATDSRSSELHLASTPPKAGQALRPSLCESGTVDLRSHLIKDEAGSCLSSPSKRKEADNVLRCEKGPTQEPKSARAAESVIGGGDLMSAAVDHYSGWAKLAGFMSTRDSLRSEESLRITEHNVLRCMMEKVSRLRDWLLNLQEPPREGCLSGFVAGRVFEGAVCVTILLNCAFMMYVADEEIKNPNDVPQWVRVGDILFLAFYTMEMVLKLVVHRQWFFCNANWKINTLDLTLVAADYISLTASGGSGGALRLVRTLKQLGRITRTVRVMAHMKHLRVLVVCIEGSFWSLFWSVVMLLMVCGLFSLVLVQVVTSYLVETGEAIEGTVFYDLFGSVGKSTLTLYKSATGGDDWANTYDVIRLSGELGSVLFLLFVSFVQFALINPIGLRHCDDQQERWCMTTPVAKTPSSRRR